jgi:type IV pilus assembly protein PilB
MAVRVREADATMTAKAVDRLRQALVDDGLVTRRQLRAAEAKAQHGDGTLSKMLVTLEYVTHDQLAGFIGDKMRIPYIDIAHYDIDRKALDLIPELIARRYKVIPLFKIEDVLTIAMSDPLDTVCIDDMASLAGCQVEAVITTEAKVNAAINQWYGMGDERQKLIEEIAAELKEPERDEESRYSKEMFEIRLKQEAAEPLIVRLVNTYIAEAMLERASDVHLEPKRDHMSVRFRIDGLLYAKHRLPADLIAPITSRIKIMAELDIANSRTPQDGRVSLLVREEPIDIRISTFPSLYGENVVLRLLDEATGVLPLTELGFSDEVLTSFRGLIGADRGIILATGPTGSGKTTTIYSAISALDRKDKNVMTIEDPIEYEIEGVVQSQVNPKAGVTFANALRSILRQDPDIIYVGEIRDLETAEIAVHAALTGHLVLSTLHTNDAVGAVTRLRDIGVKPGLIESALNCSLGQRLVRKICPACAAEYRPDKSVLEKLGLAADSIFSKGQGCESCGNTGYKGRIGIFEVLRVNRAIRALIRDGASEDCIAKAAREQGMKTLFEDGLQKVRDGITTLDELRRVTEAPEH